METQLDRFVQIIARLRSPEGCPWDREQTHRSILSCLLDEAYEFVDAVDENSGPKMREELGDLLLQIGLHAQMASEENAFDIEDVAREINEKLIRRHPHVFGDVAVGSSDEVSRNWEEIKRREKGKEHRTSVLDGIPKKLPALFRAEKMQKRAAKVGFDWESMGPVLDKVEEEFAEFRAALESDDQHHASEELGDILFALVNVARHKSIHAEEALRGTIHKFERRFRYIEQKMRGNRRKLTEASLEEMDLIWEESKKVVG
jgi:tetrapyrrole methylase family protein/MazG family protein